MATSQKHPTADNICRQSTKSNEQLGKRERNRLICYRFAQLRNATAVAKEFDVNRMYVSRLWDKLANEDREAILETSKEVTEDLNQKIVDAEKIASDGFIANVVKAREMAGKELLRRFTSKDIRMVSDRDFASLVKLVADIATTNSDDNSKVDPLNSTLRMHREAISDDINNFKK